jgi:Zn-dependent peptidase ImmA (M78 family)
MEHIQSINPRRIAWCCADYGITPTDLASAVDIAPGSMERAMAGDDGLTFAQLSRVAKYFGRGVLFFLEAGQVDEATIRTPQFRTLANQKPALSPVLKKLIERVEKQREVYLSLLEDLAERERQQFNPPDLPSEDSQEAAAIARKWLALGDTNDFDSYREAVEAKGVLVFRSNGYNGPWQIPKDSPILGFALYDVACPVIVIKKRRWDTEQSFTLMHELGHLLLHKSSSIDDDGDMQSHQGRERDANAFAGNLLVPDAFLRSISDADRPVEVSQYDDWLVGPRKLWGVSGEVILRRLLDASRLPQSQYTAYREWRRKSGKTEDSEGRRLYRYREPIHVFGGAFVRTVLDALNTRRITLAKASSHLDNLRIKDLHKLESHCAGF